MKYTLQELKNMLIYAQEAENQSMINNYAEDIARLMCDMNHDLNYNQVLYQYGYQNNFEKRVK